jgi:cell division protein FtsB
MSAFADEERKRRRATTGVFCLVLLGLTLAALAHVAVQAKRAEVAAALGREQAANHELLDRRRHLLIEINRRKDPAVLEQVARERLGLAAPHDIRRARPATALRGAP